MTTSVTPSILRNVAFLIVALLLHATDAAATECIARSGASPIQDAFAEAGQVFLGDVLSVEYVESTTQGRLRGYFRVRFSVLEPFKGPDDRERTLDFDLTAGNFRFARGQRVLVYAKMGLDATGWATFCSPTRVAERNDRLEFQMLRQLGQALR